MKRFKFGTVMAIACVLVMSHSVDAKEKKRKKKSSDSSSMDSGGSSDMGGSSSGGGERGYGLAGCGLGSIVFGPKPGMIQIVAATLNGTGMQTIGITAGTSNCDIPEMGQQAAVFIEVNKEIVKKDAARGDGESLEALGQILGCSDKAKFGQMMRDNFDSIFSPDNSTYESTRRILNNIKSNDRLAAQCGFLG